MLTLLTALAVVAAACGADTAGDDDRLSIVVTTTIWGDIVSNVATDHASVEVLFPIGADAHDYQLSSAQVASMQAADLVIVNGLGLEEGIRAVLDGLVDDGANVIELAELLDPIRFGAEADGHDENEDDDKQPSDDPHIWMDPLRAARAVDLIALELSALDPSIDWSANADSYAGELRALDAEIASILAAVSEGRRKLVTNHQAFGYFADRYGFEVVGVVIPGGSTLSDPSSAELAALVDVMTGENIDVIFAETVETAALADAVAAEVGDVSVVELFTASLSEAGAGAATYVEFLRTNATRIADALS